jgi:hypothetical protein
MECNKYVCMYVSWIENYERLILTTAHISILVHIHRGSCVISSRSMLGIVANVTVMECKKV